MTNTTRRIGYRFASLLLPVASVLAAASCSSTSVVDDDDDRGATSGAGGGGTTAAGGSVAAAGTLSAGGMAVSGAPATAGSTASGGASAGSSGVSGAPATAGSTGSASGGAPGTGGTSSSSAGSPPSGGSGQATAGSGSGNAGSSGAASGGSGGSSEAVFHIFMLMGQSNMAGVAKREAGDANTDDRIKILGGCNQPAGQWNTVRNPPLNDCPGEKGWNTSDAVDPGIWFAKTLLPKLPAGHTIGLVGTAESGESINTFIRGGSHHQMILNKINKAKTAPNGRFAGIIFHQGESDSGQDTWPDKVVQLYNEVKQAWGASYDVPFILGELPAGGCCSGHNVRVHQAAEKLPMGAWISQEGTRVMDQYHFDHASVVLMGQRYGQKMLEMLKW